MRFKKMVRFLAVITTAVLLTGCKTGKVNNNTGGTAGTEGKTIVSLATWANERESKEIDAIITKLNESQDVYEIQQLIIPSDYYTKIQTQIAGKQAPDLMWLAQEYIPVYAKNGAILDLDEMLKNQTEIDINDYLSGSLDAAKYQDKIYGLPWIGQPYVVYYNKTMFEQKGIPLPDLDWTWDDFYQVAKELTGGDVYGFASTGNPPLDVFQWGYGGETIDEEGNVLINNPNSIKGLKYAYEMLSDKTAVMPYIEAQSIGVEQGFTRGNIAMMIGGATDDVERKVREEAGFEVGMAVMPAGPEAQVTFNWTASTVISHQCKNLEAAQLALVDLTIAMFDYKIPAPVSSKVDAIAMINPDKEYALEVIKKSCEISRGFNNQPTQNEIGTYTWENIATPIYTNNSGKGNVDIDAITKEAEIQIKKIINQ